MTSKSKFLTIFIVFYILTCSYMFLAGKNHLFPYQLLHDLKSFVSPTQVQVKESPWMREKGPVYEILIEKDSIVMLGDSITHNGEWNEFMPNVGLINRGLGSDTAFKMKTRISKHINGNPKKIVLLVGTNDIFFGRTPVEIEKDYREIVQQLLKIVTPNKLLLVSVLPSNPAGRPDVSIRDVNSRIKKISDEYKCDYLDLYSKFMIQGAVVKEYYIEDMVHMSLLGYKTWVKEMNYFLI